MDRLWPLTLVFLMSILQTGQAEQTVEATCPVVFEGRIPPFIDIGA